MKKKTSIGGWAYISGGYQENPIPLETVLEALSGQGFDGIEMGSVDAPTTIPGGMNYETCFARVAEVWISEKKDPLLALISPAPRSNTSG